MTITTYAGLQAAVADWVERGDLTSRLPTFIANAEAKVNRVLRERRQQGRSTASVDAALTALPVDFAEAITVQARAGPTEAYAKLAPAPSDVLADYAEDVATIGRPRFWAVVGEELMLLPAPDQPYTVLLTYFTRLPALSDANPANWLLAAAPDIYLDGALAAFHEWDKDWEAANRHFQKFEVGLSELMAQRRPPPARLRTEPGLAACSPYDITTDR